MSFRFGIIGPLLLLAACGGGGGEAPGSTAPPATLPTLAVSGAVQKGPFLVGSTVLVNQLGPLGTPTSSTTLTEIKDSIGSFSFSTDKTGPVQIVASGYYFSELTGQISNGTLTLKALYDVSSATTQTAHVNIMTHLINDRVLQLLETGDRSLGDAIKQAQGEFIAAFNDALPASNLADFSALSVYGKPPGGSAGNAYLLALSTAFYKYASTKAAENGTTTDAELTLILNELSDDLADNGRIGAPDFFNEFVAAIRSLNPAAIVANLRQRSTIDYPNGLTVPDIAVYLNLCAGTLDCPWRAGAPMPAPSRGHAVVAFNGKIYTFGGITPSDITEPTNQPISNFTSVRVYDPETNEWTARAPMPIGGYDLDAVLVGNRIFVILAIGVNGFRNELLEYNPVDDTWETKAPKPTYRYEFASEAVDGRIYVIGGHGTIDDGPSAPGKPWTLKDYVEIYDPVTDVWTAGQPAPFAFMTRGSCVFDGKIYVFGGETNSGGWEQFILTYSPATNSWSAMSPSAQLLWASSCVRLGDYMYLIGGALTTGESADSDFIRYNPLTDTAVALSRLPTPRTRLSAEALGNEIFTFGGQAIHGPATNDTEIYDLSQ